MFRIGWTIFVYRWCANCHQKIADKGGILCPTCKAELDIELTNLLES